MFSIFLLCGSSFFKQENISIAMSLYLNFLKKIIPRTEAHFIAFETASFFIKIVNNNGK
jgi:hypothetical protein